MSPRDSEISTRKAGPLRAQLNRCNEVTVGQFLDYPAYKQRHKYCTGNRQDEITR